MSNRQGYLDASKKGRHISKTTSVPIVKPRSVPSTKFSCSDAVKADLFGNSTPQAPRHTPPKFVPKKKLEVLKLGRRRTERKTDVTSTKETPKLILAELTKEDPLLTLCPYCQKTLTTSLSPTLPPALKVALEAIETASKEHDNNRRANSDLPRRRFVSNREKFRFCQLHTLELNIKPDGIKSGFPVDLDFTGLGTRVESLVPALTQVINGDVNSPYRDIALAAYKDMGVHKARSAMGVMSRFEKTLPGYYGPKGASIILKTLNDRLLHTGLITFEKTRPQLPLEYIQQVLVPETGWRLIQDDLVQSGEATGKGQTMDQAQRARVLMEQSRDFGTKVYPVDDDDDGISTTNDNDCNNNSDDSSGASSDDEDTNDFTDILEYVSSGEESSHS